MCVYLFEEGSSLVIAPQRSDIFPRHHLKSLYSVRCKLQRTFKLRFIYITNYLPCLVLLQFVALVFINIPKFPSVKSDTTFSPSLKIVFCISSVATLFYDKHKNMNVEQVLWQIYTQHGLDPTELPGCLEFSQSFHVKQPNPSGQVKLTDFSQ